jgi:hypothetical protein
MISQFRGEYRFLSNFYESPMCIHGFWWKTNEHFYQANKALHDEDFERILNSDSPKDARRLGRIITIRPTFDRDKDRIMMIGLMAKFSDPYLADRLYATGNRTIIEGNWHNDKYWGVCLKTGFGLNKLGKMLMEVREILPYLVRV